MVGIDHVALRVSDLQRSIDFYTSVLGLKLERQRPELGLAHLRAGSTLIDLIAERPQNAETTHRHLGLDHFCLCLNDFSTEQVATHLSAHRVHSGHPTLRYGATGDGYSIYLQDPDGHGVELRGQEASPEA